MRNTTTRLSICRTSGPARHAYTLVEVLVVVAIMGIAAACVIPSMLKAGTLQVQSAGRLIIEDILYAQSYGIAQGNGAIVTFNVPGNSYTLTDGLGNPIMADWRMGGGTGSYAYVVNFTTDPKFSGCTMTAANFNSTNVLTFDALGTPSSSGTVTITMANTTYNVSVAAFTGRVTIAPGP